jgi:hypothetical protein
MKKEKQINRKIFVTSSSGSLEDEKEIATEIFL